MTSTWISTNPSAAVEACAGSGFTLQPPNWAASASWVGEQKPNSHGIPSNWPRWYYPSCWRAISILARMRRA